MYASLVPQRRLIFRVEGAPSNVLYIVGGVGGSIVTLDRLMQPSNRYCPKVVTELDIVSERNALHPLKQLYSPIDLSESGNTSSVNDVQYSKA